MTERDIQTCTEEWRKKCQNYYLTVNAILALKFHLDGHDLGCSFISSERTLRPVPETVNRTPPVTPDFLLQYDGGTKGVVGEVKASIMVGYLPGLEQDPDRPLREALDQIKNADTDLRGWDTPSDLVESHDLVLLCHDELIPDIVPKIQQWLSEGKYSFSRRFAVWKWLETSSLRTGQGLYVSFSAALGETGAVRLNAELAPTTGIKVYIKDSAEYEHMKFVRAPPPVFYTMEIIYLHQLNDYPEDEEGYVEVCLSDLMDSMMQYYYSWANIPGQASQVRPTWIKEAFEMFVALGLAIRTDDDTIRIHIRRQIGRMGFRDYVITKYCQRMRIRRGRTLETWFSPTAGNGRES